MRVRNEGYLRHARQGAKAILCEYFNKAGAVARVLKRGITLRAAHGLSPSRERYGHMAGDLHNESASPNATSEEVLAVALAQRINGELPVRDCGVGCLSVE